MLADDAASSQVCGEMSGLASWSRPLRLRPLWSRRCGCVRRFCGCGGCGFDGFRRRRGCVLVRVQIRDHSNPRGRYKTPEQRAGHHNHSLAHSKQRAATAWAIVD